MQAKEIKKDIYDIDALIDERFGKEGTPERAEAEERAYTFYTGAIIEDARKKAKISKAELARRHRPRLYNAHRKRTDRTESFYLLPHSRRPRLYCWTYYADWLIQQPAQKDKAAALH